MQILYGTAAALLSALDDAKVFQVLAFLQKKKPKNQKGTLEWNLFDEAFNSSVFSRDVYGTFLWQLCAAMLSWVGQWVELVVYKQIQGYQQKYSRLRCLLHGKGLVICFYLGWSGSTLLITKHIIKVGSKS